MAARPESVKFAPILTLELVLELYVFKKTYKLMNMQLMIRHICF